MKLSSLMVLVGLSVLISMPLVSVYADHNGPGGGLADRLSNDARRLSGMVNYSYMRYPVKAAVSQFSMEMERFENCSDRSLSNFTADQSMGRMEAMGHLGSMDHNGGDRGCYYELQNVKQSWYRVDRYLSDTYYDYPGIYQLYVQIRNDLSMLRLL
jgi:hypothetical protein